MRSRSDLTLIAYVASPHGGYLELFRKYAGSHLCVLGEEFLEEFPQLTRHLPGVRPDDAVCMIEALGIFRSVSVLGHKGLARLADQEIVMPDEDVSHAIAKKYLANARITFDPSWRLRWDWQASHHQRAPEGEIVVSQEALDRAFMQTAHQEAARSPDWWRQVGAVLAREGEILLAAHNIHLPAEQAGYVLGDPRSSFSAGERIDVSIALHSEIGIIAEAAKRGISMEGCDLYVTTFPCPPCAYACSKTGIRRLFYQDGYSLIAGADALRAASIELIRVQ